MLYTISPILVGMLTGSSAVGMLMVITLLTGGPGVIGLTIAVVWRKLEDPQGKSREKTSLLAVASLVLAMMTVIIGPVAAVPSLVCGFVARYRIGRRPEELTGKGLAVAGIVLSCAGTVLWAKWTFG